jgi:hypothetical protein
MLLVVPLLISKIGFKLSGSIMIGFLIIYLIVGFFMAPDTRGKTLDEIEMGWYGTKTEENPFVTDPLIADEPPETANGSLL